METPPAVDVAGLLARLVAIDSRNPALGHGPGEAEAAAHVAGLLGAAGFEVETVEPAPGRPSVLARLPGTGGGAALMLNGHLDTVGFGAMAGPLDPRVEGGRMHGRGSYDMKGGVAAVLAAALEVARGPRPRGDLLVACVADEEHASVGTEAVLERARERGLRADYGLVAEPTGMRICVAHKGFVWATLTTHGRAAHGSAWEDGVDAIVRMGRVLVALEQLDQDLHLRRAHPLLGVPSLHASLISGGAELSTYPGRCELQIERRTVPGESVAQVWSELDRILDGLRAADPLFRADMALGLARSPMEAGLDTPLVAGVRAAAAARLGAEPPLFGMAGWTDAALMADAGIPSVLFGPSGEGAHADVEWVDLDSVSSCAAIFADLARTICA